MTDSQYVLDSNANLPKHIAIIMDGNGRWAQLQGKARVFGHKNGVETVRDIVGSCSELGIEALTLFAFSSENWKRPEKEVSVLMDLFMYVLTREVKKMHKGGLRFQVIGDISRFSKKLQTEIQKAHELTQDNTGMTLSIAANYGGRWDIAQAAQTLAQQVANGERSVEDVTEDAIDKHIMLNTLPPLDLLIRTGGDYRISNFLLWQAAYAELYFTDVLWPDFTLDTLKEALLTFDRRERRFGQTSEQVVKQQNN
ncbi:Undecaprenyl pyrophosphate synthetase [Thalassotalea agarivorans]|uniref:Ditrans,polycis-undecaprenyl-diphosphate synthase ((2E,6E)-farnesyl-diphosphate specific) n=1 Tax=Thalassotalea agarivorans TaxID=349064 RepID=A0A1H9ZSN7_THASX|nr:Undecaprenyl pyrophosphate synthetase [Thalassotalea agarivorans]